MGVLETLGLGTGRSRFFGVSSACPGRLLDYSTLGIVLSDELVARASGVAIALESLATSDDPDGFVPSMGEVAPTLTDLAADWHHLDGYVGDVGRRFALFLDPTWDGDRAALGDRSVIAFDGVLSRLGGVGFADRDAAIAAATADLAVLHELHDARHPSADDIEALAQRVRRGQHDPAYAVTMLDALGPDGLLDVVALIEYGYSSPRNAGTPDEGWALEQLAPFGTMLGTALGPAADGLSGRGLGAESGDDPSAQPRLSDDWLPDFVDLGLDADGYEAFHHSLLVSQADLPAWALLALVDARVTDKVRRGFEGPQVMVTDETLPAWGGEANSTEANLLRGLGRDGEASARWLSDVDDDGVTNAQALIRYDIGNGYVTQHGAIGEALVAGLGDAASDIWAAGGPQLEPDLFVTVVDEVAGEGTIHLAGMEPGLAAATAAHLDTVQGLVNDGFNPSEIETTPAFDRTAVFLREVLRNDEAVSVLSAASGEYLRDQLRTLPDGAGRGDGLSETGRTIGVISQAQANAIMAEEGVVAAASGHASDRVNVAIGMLPFGLGQAHDVLDAIGPSVGQLLFGESGRAEAGEEARDALFQADRAVAVITSVHHYNEGSVDADAAIAAADAFVREFDDDELDVDLATIRSVFLEPDGTPRAQLPPIASMTDGQIQALRAWVFSDDATGPGQEPGRNPVREDFADLSIAIGQIRGRLVYGG